MKKVLMAVLIMAVLITVGCNENNTNDPIDDSKTFHADTLVDLTDVLLTSSKPYIWVYYPPSSDVGDTLYFHFNLYTLLINDTATAEGNLTYRVNNIPYVPWNEKWYDYQSPYYGSGTWEITDCDVCSLRVVASDSAYTHALIVKEWWQ